MVYKKKKSEGHCERQNPTVSYQSFTSVSVLNLILFRFWEQLSLACHLHFEVYGRHSFTIAAAIFQS